MKNNEIKSNNSNCQIHVMPTTISDNDLTALFNGLLNVVKKKFELDNQSKVINMSNDMKTLVLQLKEKQAECNRLKNEIVHLKSIIEVQKHTF